MATEMTLEHDLMQHADGGAVAKTQQKVAGCERLLVPDVKLKASAVANSKQLEKRCNYLWQAAHSILPTNTLLAHQMM